jgi:hypothetical protein
MGHGRSPAAQYFELSDYNPEGAGSLSSNKLALVPYNWTVCREHESRVALAAQVANSEPALGDLGEPGNELANGADATDTKPGTKPRASHPSARSQRHQSGAGTAEEQLKQQAASRGRNVVLASAKRLAAMQAAVLVHD